MTVAMYLLPSVEVAPGLRVPQPLLLADTVATRMAVNAPKVLPATVTPQSAASPRSNSIFRKNYIFGTHTAVAFAGEEEAIRSVFDEIRHQMPIWLRQKLPMDPLTRLVNEYKGINIVGAALDPTIGRANHIAPNSSWIDLGCLERCAVIGSGRDAVIRHARGFDRRLEGDARARGDRAIGFAVELAAQVLFDEMTGAAAPDWGGYIEWITIDAETQLWRRQPRTLHLYLEGVRRGSDEATLVPLPRSIAYDPGNPHGCLLVTTPSGASVEFVFEDLMFPIREHPAPPFASLWDGWVPEQVVTTVMFPDPVWEGLLGLSHLRTRRRHHLRHKQRRHLHGLVARAYG